MGLPAAALVLQASGRQTLLERVREKSGPILADLRPGDLRLRCQHIFYPGTHREECIPCFFAGNGAKRQL